MIANAGGRRLSLYIYTGERVRSVSISPGRVARKEESELVLWPGLICSDLSSGSGSGRGVGSSAWVASEGPVGAAIAC